MALLHLPIIPADCREVLPECHQALSPGDLAEFAEVAVNNFQLFLTPYTLFLNGSSATYGNVAVKTLNCHFKIYSYTIKNFPLSKSFFSLQLSKVFKYNKSCTLTSL